MVWFPGRVSYTLNIYISLCSLPCVSIYTEQNKLLLLMKLLLSTMKFGVFYCLVIDLKHTYCLWYVLLFYIEFSFMVWECCQTVHNAACVYWMGSGVRQGPDLLIGCCDHLAACTLPAGHAGVQLLPHPISPSERFKAARTWLETGLQDMLQYVQTVNSGIDGQYWVLCPYTTLVHPHGSVWVTSVAHPEHMLWPVVGTLSEQCCIFYSKVACTALRLLKNCITKIHSSINDWLTSWNATVEPSTKM